VGIVIEADGLSKRYGAKLAVDQASFRVSAGKVTGFLGPNGAGKSTTMRMIVGLDTPSAGRVRVNGRSYRDLSTPLREVGVLLDAKAAHKGRSAYHHLSWLARSNDIPHRRVEEVLGQVGLEGVARKRVKGFSLGMSQRLGIAAALLGDPAVLIFDEPTNGLDPEGIHWIRALMRDLAAQGRTVLVASHLMSEMALTADHLIVIGQGRILTDTDIASFVAANATSQVRVRSPQHAELEMLLTGHGWHVDRADDGALLVQGPDTATIGDAAAEASLRIHELTPLAPSLEEAFMRLTSDAIEYHSVPAAPLPSGGRN